jgi:mRNA interferase MazF
MKPGDIVLIPLPQSDGQLKKRPALLIKQMPKFGDWLICGISTQLHQFVPNFDEKLDASHVDYVSSKLLAPSIVRLGFLTTVSSNKIQTSIGKISKVTLSKLVDNLAAYLKK